MPQRPDLPAGADQVRRIAVLVDISTTKSPHLQALHARARSIELLKTATALGLTIPPAVLARADRVIE